MRALDVLWQTSANLLKRHLCLGCLLIFQVTGTTCSIMFHYVFAHGTDVKSAKMIMTQGVIRPYTWNPQDATDFPSFGFYGLGAVGAFSPHLTTQLLKKIWKISKGKQGVVILGEVTSTKEHGTLESGGTTDEQHLVRRKAVVKGKERWCFHSTHAHIQAIVMMRPI